LTILLGVVDIGVVEVLKIGSVGGGDINVESNIDGDDDIRSTGIC